MAAAGAIMALLCGCEPTQLYIAHDTKLGLHAGVNTELTAGYVEIGYDRYFVSFVPTTVQPTAGGPKQAMSALSCSTIEIETIFLRKFAEHLATGEAAKKLTGAGKVLPPECK